jgi:hypothetical protein
MGQANYFLQTHPKEKALSVEDLIGMVNKKESTLLMKKLARYAANVKGTNGYWR